MTIVVCLQLLEILPAMTIMQGSQEFGCFIPGKSLLRRWKRTGTGTGYANWLLFSEEHHTDMGLFRLYRISPYICIYIIIYIYHIYIYIYHIYNYIYIYDIYIIYIYIIYICIFPILFSHDIPIKTYGFSHRFSIFIEDLSYIFSIDFLYFPYFPIFFLYFHLIEDFSYIFPYIFP